MPSATSRSTLTRQWELLKLLPPKGPGITTLELQSRLSDAGHPTTKRTIERDLVELSRLFPLQCNSKGMPYGWHWMPGKSAELPGISLSEALTLRLVEDSIRPLIPAFMLKTLESRFNLARQKLEAMSDENPSARWLDKVASVQPELSQTPPEIKADLLEIIQQALMNDTQLSCRYYSAHKNQFHNFTLIREFTKRRNPQPEDFYCLQPLVMRVSEEGGYEVVDGQQRLTTLMLILRHFNERLTEKYRQPVFRLEYETRPELLKFLDEPTEELANKNVDFFHLKMAMDAIEEWFADKDSELEEIKSAFQGKAKVIWYEIAETEHPVDVFTRLNVGKIPLTNDELIRALFLKRSSGDQAESLNLQTQIAYEWDHIEKALQADAFWYFVSNDLDRAQNRIGLLFELVASAEGIPEAFKHDPYGIFFTFGMRLKQPGVSLEAEWRKIKQAFLLLEEWYEDRVLFHMIGYLVSENTAINSIRELSSNCSKSGFQQRLRQEIFAKAIDAKAIWPLSKQEVRELVAERLDTLKYPSPKIKSLLLLFNVATLLQNTQSNLRFQFDSFKGASWNIEHVRSITADSGTIKARVEFSALRASRFRTNAKHRLPTGTRCRWRRSSRCIVVSGLGA